MVNCFGDGGQSLKVRAMPGPMRLRHHDKLFEPIEGFEVLSG